MNAHSPPRLSLIERAAQVYDFDAAVRRRDEAVTESQGDPALRTALPTEDAPSSDVASAPRAVRAMTEPHHGTIDRTALEERGFVLPDAPAGVLAEELRIIKRSLLAAVRDKPPGKGQVVMICSARPDDGKTFSAVNLGLSLAGERDIEVLLVDGDVAKPEVLSTLGLEGGTGLVDALMDPFVVPESLIIRTDLPGLSVLPAGRQAHNATELLSSARMAKILVELTVGHPRRLVLFDSPPALAASAASAIAGHVGQVIMVVRADRTSETDLREAVGLVDACGDVKLILNGAAYASGKKRFSYYGPEQ